jgi:predicted amino acid racemase
MAGPRLRIDTSLIEQNVRALVRLCARKDIQVMGVTKGTLAEPQVARAMLRGGVRRLGDSRLSNIGRLRNAGVRAHITLLRSPMLSEVTQTVTLADRSLVSDASVLRPVARAALEAGTAHEVVLMVDLGDLREGFWPQCESWSGLHSDSTLDEALETASRLDGLSVVGVGTNLACLGGVIPTPEKMQRLVEIAGHAARILGRPLEVVSGGNSANLGMVLDGRMPSGVTELRLGEALLLGTEAVNKTPVPGCSQRAFTLVAEVIEVRDKPSRPLGQIGIDAFGTVPVHEDRGIRRRAICAVGRQDVDHQDLRPRVQGIEVVGASSDHLVLDVTGASPMVATGDEICFDVGYSCMLRACTSPFVAKVFV